MIAIDPNLQVASFTDLPLAPPLLNNLKILGFSQCTPIQAKTLPLLLEGKDVAGQAQTGTGKTAAFLLGLFHQLLGNEEKPNRRVNQPRALILAPSRELAIQIHKDACTIGLDTQLRLGLAYGGEDYNKQRNQIGEGVDILIGTPGRIIDYHKQQVFDLKAIEVFVLDEADRMFDMGFIKDIRYLLRRMPPPTERQNLLFSATLSLRVMELAYEHMNSPVTVEIKPEQVTSEQVEQTLFHVANAEKIPLLIQILRTEQPDRCMIFLNTKRESEKLTQILEANDFKCGLMTGDVAQRKRNKLLEKFKQGEYPILVATDVAARGLHITGLSHVINFDLPQDPEDYVHRIGRTARAGASGTAISLACERYVYSLIEIEEYLGHKIPCQDFDHTQLPTIEQPNRRTQYQKRKKPTDNSGSSHSSSSSPNKRTKSNRGKQKAAPSQSRENLQVPTNKNQDQCEKEEIPALFGGRPWENNS